MLCSVLCCTFFSIEINIAVFVMTTDDMPRSLTVLCS